MRPKTRTVHPPKAPPRSRTASPTAETVAGDPEPEAAPQDTTDAPSPAAVAEDEESEPEAAEDEDREPETAASASDDQDDAEVPGSAEPPGPPESSGATELTETTDSAPAAASASDDQDRAEVPGSAEPPGPPESSEAPEPIQSTDPTPAAETPRGEDEEAMVTANPPIPDIAEPEADGATDVSGAREITGLPALDETGGAPNEAAGELPLPRVIAIANQKGGVGKTTTAVNLGAALAEAGYRVLVVDLDPQGNASTGLGINHRDVESSVYDVIMTDAPALDCVEPTSLKNLFVLPATIDLAGAEIELVSAFSRELKLRRALDLVRPEYDIILIDCPPSLGLLTVNGLAAADDVIVPVQSEYYALEGLGQLLKNVAMVRSLNPTLDVRGIVLTMHDSRTKLAEQVEHEVREHFGARVYKTVVPRTVRLSEAPSFGQPIIVFDPTSRGATAYRELAKEVSGGATRRTR